MKAEFNFIDLFAGIGGIRIAFEKNGGNCVFSSEYDKFSQITYEAYFGKKPIFNEICDVEPPGDITKIDPKLIPDHDILTAGFPCQPFSLAGVSKKNSLGRPHGFEDPTQGTLFFNIKSILEEKQPKAFLLENVKNLRSHDKGRTYNVIQETLQGLGYNIFDRVIDASGWVPQHRERIFIVGFRGKKNGQNWEVNDFPELYSLKNKSNKHPSLAKILEPDVAEKYTLTDKTWATLKRHKAFHEAKGQGFGYQLLLPPFDKTITRTLSARYHKDGAEILIYQEGKNPRRLTPLECSRLMGFPLSYNKFYKGNAKYPQPVSDTQAYRQFGNSVVVPVVESVAKLIISKLCSVGALNSCE